MVDILSDDFITEDVEENEDIDINEEEDVEVVDEEVVDEDTVVEDDEEVIDEDSEEKEEEPEPKKFKVKVDGVESEVDEAELIKGYQLEQAARKRLTEASKQMKTLEDALRVGREEPLQLLEWLGLEPEKFIKEYVMNKVEESKLSPEQRELRQLRKEKERIDAERQEAEKQRQEAERQKHFQETGDALEDEILEALGNMKANKHMIAQVANIMLVGLNQGKTISAKEAVARIQNDTQSLLNSALESDDVDKFINSLPREARSRLQKALAKQHIAKQKVTATSRHSDKSSKKKLKRSGFDDLFGDAKTI